MTIRLHVPAFLLALTTSAILLAPTARAAESQLHEAKAFVVQSANVQPPEGLAALDTSSLKTQDRVDYDVGLTQVAHEQCSPLAIDGVLATAPSEAVQQEIYAGCVEAVHDSLQILLPGYLCAEDGLDIQALAHCGASIGGLFESSDVAASEETRGRLDERKLGVMLACRPEPICLPHEG